MSEPEPEITIVKFKSAVPVPWRLRIRLWWYRNWTRRRMSEAQRRIIDEAEGRTMRAFLWGEE